MNYPAWFIYLHFGGEYENRATFQIFNAVIHKVFEFIQLLSNSEQNSCINLYDKS